MADQETTEATEPTSDVAVAAVAEAAEPAPPAAEEPVAEVKEAPKKESATEEKRKALKLYRMCCAACDTAHEVCIRDRSGWNTIVKLDDL